MQWEPLMSFEQKSSIIRCKFEKNLCNCCLDQEKRIKRNDIISVFWKHQLQHENEERHNPSPLDPSRHKFLEIRYGGLNGAIHSLSPSPTEMPCSPLLSSKRWQEWCLSPGCNRTGSFLSLSLGLFTVRTALPRAWVCCHAVSSQSHTGRSRLDTPGGRQQPPAT